MASAWVTGRGGEALASCSQVVWLLAAAGPALHGPHNVGGPRSPAEALIRAAGQGSTSRLQGALRQRLASRRSGRLEGLVLPPPRGEGFCSRGTRPGGRRSPRWVSRALRSAGFGCGRRGWRVTVRPRPWRAGGCDGTLRGEGRGIRSAAHHSAHPTPGGWVPTRAAPEQALMGELQAPRPRRLFLLHAHPSHQPCFRLLRGSVNWPTKSLGDVVS